MQTIDVLPLTGALGAEVRGIDLGRLSDDELTWLHELWLQHLVLFFPGQHPTPEAHVAFGARFGPLEIHPFLEKLDQHPQIVVLDSERTSAADVWHTDVSFSPTPPMASILHMVDLPSRGGDTIWTNQYLAFESLSPAMRDFVSKLTAVHTGARFGRPDIRAVHPVVVRHPETGRSALFVNRTFTSHISELAEHESTAVLDALYERSEQPMFQCRYRWTEGTVAVWDNRCTQHYAVNDYQEHRRVHRVTVIGAAPIGDRPGWEPVHDKARDRADRPRQPATVDPRANTVTDVT